MLRVFTDGASSIRVPGAPGGWAWWVSDDVCDAGNAGPTTSNRMELTAVISALVALQDDAKAAGGILVVTDSMYVVNCFADRWYDNWRAHDWMKRPDPTSGVIEEVKNRDLWERLLQIYEEYAANGIPVTFKHVRGHGADVNADPELVHGNDMADKLAVQAKKLRMI